MFWIPCPGLNQCDLWLAQPETMRLSIPRRSGSQWPQLVSVRHVGEYYSRIVRIGFDCEILTYQFIAMRKCGARVRGIAEINKGTPTIAAPYPYPRVHRLNQFDGRCVCIDRQTAGSGTS